MLTLALCRDSVSAREGRREAFEPHIQYLRRIMGTIRLAAPLAISDGARIDGGDALVASIFVLESPSFLGARELMSADPYFTSRVWETVSLFQIEQPSGPWASGSTGVTGRLYAALHEPSDQPVPGPADLKGYASELGDSLTFAGLTRFKDRLGVARAADEVGFALTLLGAASLNIANELINQAIGRLRLPWRGLVWAIPRGVGTWTADTTL
jgi:hypothetical protein